MPEIMTPVMWVLGPAKGGLDLESVSEPTALGLDGPGSLILLRALSVLCGAVTEG